MNIFQEAKAILDKDGKVNPLGPYGKQKLTGREISTYFRRNKITDPEIKKAVEVALDLGGAFDIAGKEIQKFYGRAVRNSKEVKNALIYANESSILDGESLDEDYKKVIKMYPRDNDWKKLITKHKRAIDAFRKNNKDLPSDVEDELLDWATEYGIIDGKHDAEDFIISILDESTISEGKNLMPAIQKIVDEKGAAKVGGVMVDMFTASVLTQAYAKVNDSNKKKMEGSNIQTLVKLAQRVMGMKESLDEEVIVYKVKGIQKPETEKFQSSAKLMKLKVSFKKKGSDTLVTMTGNKKQLRDFDSVARGKSSYGDPSSVQHFDEGHIKEAKGLSIEIQVKNVRDLKKCEMDAQKNEYDESIMGILESYFEIAGEDHKIKISGNKMLITFNEEDLEDYGTDMEDQFELVGEFCRAYTSFSKDTSKEIQKYIKGGGDIKSLDPSDIEARNGTDPYYVNAVIKGQADPKKPFVYTTKLV